MGGPVEVAGDQLRAIVERIEHVEDEIRELNEAKKEIFLEAKSNGFDVKVLREVIRIRKKDKQERDEQETLLVWKARESGLGATSQVPGEPEAWEGWEDAAVSPEKLGEYLRGLHRLLAKYGYHCALYGHFCDACVHMRIDFDLVTEKGIKDFRAFVEEAADMVVAMGGSLSGEHGDGQARGELLVKMFGPELMEAFREFKRIWDPAWKMNPRKKIDANPLDQNLRLGATYRPAPVKTYF